MKKALFIGTLAGAMGFYACKKDDKTITVTENVNDTIINTIFPKGQVDPNTLSDGITVAYGTKVGDSLLPAASTDAAAPKLDSLYERDYTAIKGGYLFLRPPGISGSVAGYYFKIAGSKSYYKISYPAIVNDLRKQKGAAARFEGDNADSLIMVKIPLDIKGDTFSIRYAGYDATGRVSNSITTRVVLLPQGSSAFQDSLAGKWTYYGNKSHSIDIISSRAAANEDFEVDTIIDYSSTLFTCNNNTLTADDNGELELMTYYYSHFSYLNFDKGTFELQEKYSGNNLSVENSTCSNLVYTKSFNGSSSYNYEFAFDPATRNMYRITYREGYNTGMYYTTYHIDELSANRLVWSYDNGEGTDNLYLITELFTR